MNSVAQMWQQAVQYHQAGNLHQAELLYKQILEMDPLHVDALHLIGVIAHQNGQNDLAVEYIQQALRLHPKFSAAHLAHNNLGNALKVQGKLAEAIISYRQALRLKPNFAEAHNNLASTLKEQGQLDEAIAGFQQALRLRPDYAEAHNNLGNALKDQGKFDEAIINYQQALRLKPDFAMAYNNLGNALLKQDKEDEAVVCYRQAVRFKPDFDDAHTNLGAALHNQGKYDEAAACHRQALRLKPDNATAHTNLGMWLLLHGNLEQGWPEFEWRWQTKQLKQSCRDFGQPLWQGNSLPDGTILLHAEQGLGDTIQFIRFAALVKDNVGTVLCECRPVLVRLLQSCAWIDKVIPFGEPLPPFDVHTPILSLPGILKTTLETIPARIPYLHADTARTEAYAPLLGSSQDFKVGIVWQAGRQLDTDHRHDSERRSMSLALFEPLARLPGVRLISLQKDYGTEQLQEFAGRFPISDLGSTFNDLSDTAALMKNLDLVISADTATAHLAGALGVPVWVPLPLTQNWRWLLYREDSPWYPTMRLFRQKRQGEWDEVFERIVAAVVAVRETFTRGVRSTSPRGLGR